MALLVELPHAVHAMSVELRAVTESADQRWRQELVADEPTAPMILVDAIAISSHWTPIPRALKPVHSWFARPF